MHWKLRFFSKYVEAVAFEFAQMKDPKHFVHSPYLYGSSTVTTYNQLLTYLACWPLIPKFAGSSPAEAFGFLKGDKKPSARLPSEGK